MASNTKISLSAPKPMWAKIAFRVVFYMCKGIIAYVAVSHIVPTSVAYEVTLIITLIIEPAAHGISNLFGIKHPEK